MNLWNQLVHVATGFWVGYAINEPKYRHGAWALLAFIGMYQGLGVWSKGDKGYPEIKETMVGLGIALAYKRWLALPQEQRDDIILASRDIYDELKVKAEEVWKKKQENSG